jgi:hypothetical protein
MQKSFVYYLALANVPQVFAVLCGSLYTRRATLAHCEECGYADGATGSRARGDESLLRRTHHAGGRAHASARYVRNKWITCLFSKLFLNNGVAF